MGAQVTQDQKTSESPEASESPDQPDQSTAPVQASREAAADSSLPDTSLQRLVPENPSQPTNDGADVQAASGHAASGQAASAEAPTPGATLIPDPTLAPDMAPALAPAPWRRLVNRRVMAAGAVAVATAVGFVSDVVVNGRDLYCALVPAGLDDCATPTHSDGEISQMLNDLRAQAEAGNLSAAEQTLLAQYERRWTEQRLAQLEAVFGPADTDTEAADARRTAVAAVASKGTAAERAAVETISAGDAEAGFAELEAQARAKDTDAAATWRRIGGLAYDIDTARAITAYEKAHALDGTEVWDAIFLTRLYLRGGQSSKALALAEKLLVDLPGVDTRAHAAVWNDIAQAKDFLGDEDGAFEGTSEAVRIMDQLAADQPENLKRQADAAAARLNSATMLVNMSRPASALVRYKHVRDTMQRLVALEPDNLRWQDTLLAAQTHLGDLYATWGAPASALEQYQAALDLSENITQKKPDDLMAKAETANILGQLGQLEYRKDDMEAARTYFQQAVSLMEDIAGKDPANTYLQFQLSNRYLIWADFLKDEDKDRKGAATTYGKVLDIRERLAIQEKANLAWQKNLAIAHGRLASLAIEEDNWDMAQPHYDASQAIFSALLRETSVLENEHAYAQFYRRMALAFREAGDSKRALEQNMKAHAFLLNLTAHRPNHLIWQQTHAKILSDLSMQWDREGNEKAALNMMRRAHDILAHLVETVPDHTRWQQDHFAALVGLQLLNDPDYTWDDVSRKYDYLVENQLVTEELTTLFHSTARMLEKQRLLEQKRENAAMTGGD